MNKLLCIVTSGLTALLNTFFGDYEVDVCSHYIEHDYGPESPGVPACTYPQDSPHFSAVVNHGLCDASCPGHNPTIKMYYREVLKR
jgi:hypothetical protein